MACFPLAINLCHSLPLPHTHTHQGKQHTHRDRHKQTHTHEHTHSNHTQCDRSLIMPLILSDSGMYNGWFPGGHVSKHPPIHPTIPSSIYHHTYLVIHPSFHPSAHVSTQILPFLSSVSIHFSFISLPAPRLSFSVPIFVVSAAFVGASLSNFLCVTHHLLHHKGYWPGQSGLWPLGPQPRFTWGWGPWWSEVCQLRGWVYHTSHLCVSESEWILKLVS